MNNQKDIILILFISIFSLCPFLIHAQWSISAKVLDMDYPIEFANVFLRDTAQFMQSGTITNQDGFFRLQAPEGTYTLTVSFMGYQDYTQKIQLERDTVLKDIILETNAHDIEEIVITGKRALIEYKADRMVFNIGNHLSSSGGNALDALSIAPGLVVDHQNINMLGKGASRVMINGRLIELSGEDLIEFLNNIAATDIQNIEIITNPPAKYEAGSIGGLVNINLKKGALNAWKNSLNVAYHQNKYAFVNAGNGFFYNKGKWRFSTHISGTKGSIAAQQDLDIFYPDGLWSLSASEKRLQDKYAGRMALDYDLSEKTTIGVQYIGQYAHPNSFIDTKIDIFNTSNSLDSNLINSATNHKTRHSHTANAHFIQHFKEKGKILSMDMDYFSFSSTSDNNFVAEMFKPNGEFLNTNFSGQDLNHQDITNYSVKIDMEHPMRFAQLSYGAKISFTRSLSNRQFFNTLTGLPVLDINQSDEFEYEENNQALYLSAAKNISQQISLKVGLRLENTQTKGFSKTLQRHTKNDYIKLFPTIYVAYQASDQHHFSFNYGKRINRPAFWILNPFRSYINSNSYSEGNPFIQPSFIDQLELTHVFRRKLRTSINFNVTQEGFGVIFSANPTTNTQIISRDNYYKEYGFAWVENYTTEINSWWQSSNTFALINAKSHFSTEIEAIPRNSFQVYLSTKNTFKINPYSSVQLDISYQNPFERSLYSMGYIFGMDVGFQQKLWSNKLQLSLFIHDIFNTAFLKDYTSRVNQVEQVYAENNSSRFARLSISYQFGNDKIKVKNRGFGNEDEQNRSK